MRSIRPKRGETIAVKRGDLPVTLVLSDGTRIGVLELSLWRIHRQSRGTHGKQIYLVDRTHFKANGQNIGRKQVLPTEEIILGLARNQLYFGHSRWSRRLKQEEVKVWRRGGEILFQGL